MPNSEIPAACETCNEKYPPEELGEWIECGKWTCPYCLMVSSVCCNFCAEQEI
jgi:hypothetical protein